MKQKMRNQPKLSDDQYLVITLVIFLILLLIWGCGDNKDYHPGPSPQPHPNPFGDSIYIDNGRARRLPFSDTLDTIYHYSGPPDSSCFVTLERYMLLDMEEPDTGIFWHFCNIGVPDSAIAGLKKRWRGWYCRTWPGECDSVDFK